PRRTPRAASTPEAKSACYAIPSPTAAEAGPVPWRPDLSRHSQSRMYKVRHGYHRVRISPKHNMRLSETQQWPLRLRLGARSLDAQLFHLAVEVRALDPQVTCGVAEVAAVGGEPVEDVLALEPRARQAQRQVPLVGAAHGGHLQEGHDLLMGHHLLGHQHHPS